MKLPPPNIIENIAKEVIRIFWIDNFFFIFLLIFKASDKNSIYLL